VPELWTLGISAVMDYPDYLKNGDWKDYSIGLYPENHKPWVVLAFFAIITFGMIMGYLTGYYWTCFVAAFIVSCCVSYMTFPISCPKCGGQVVTRIVDDDAKPDVFYSYHHDCPKCKVTWVSKKYYHPTS
jgi:hypothetical protein